MRTQQSYYADQLGLITRFALARLRYQRSPLALVERSTWRDVGTAMADGVGQPACVPRILWIYWHEASLPPLISATVARIRALHPDDDVRLVHRNTITDWIADFDWPRAPLSAPHFTDLLRLDLLARHGGIWVDAAVILQAPIDVLFNLRDDASDQTFDLYGFYLDRFTQDSNRPMIENWLIAAPAKSPVVVAWLAALEPMRHEGAPALARYQQAQDNYEMLRQAMPATDYLMANIALQQALLDLDTWRVRVVRAEDEAFRYQRAHGDWDSFNVVAASCARAEGRRPPRIVKLIGHERDMVSVLLRRGLVKQTSLVGRLVAEFVDGSV